MGLGLLACLSGACCIGCLGVISLRRSRSRTRPAQKYMTVGEDDDEDGLLHEPRFSDGLDESSVDAEEDEPPEVEPEPVSTPAPDAFARGVSALPSGPRVGNLIGDQHAAASAVDVTSESWIAEMDAELAEFDALTSTPTSLDSPLDTRLNRYSSVDTDLGRHLATTPKIPL
eukprot:scaffold156130_cov31-Tisochrysis_lutea.AAC.3